MTLINPELYEQEAPTTPKAVALLVETLLTIGAAALLGGAIAMTIMAVTS